MWYSTFTMTTAPSRKEADKTPEGGGVVLPEFVQELQRWVDDGCDMSESEQSYSLVSQFQQHAPRCLLSLVQDNQVSIEEAAQILIKVANSLKSALKRKAKNEIDVPQRNLLIEMMDRAASTETLVALKKAECYRGLFKQLAGNPQMFGGTGGYISDPIKNAIIEILRDE